MHNLIAVLGFIIFAIGFMLLGIKRSMDLPGNLFRTSEELEDESLRLAQNCGRLGLVLIVLGALIAMYGLKA